MNILIINGFGYTRNLGVHAVLLATVSLFRSIDPQCKIDVVAWQRVSPELGNLFRGLLGELDGVSLVSPILPAPLNRHPYPTSSMIGKVRTIVWSIWANAAAEFKSRLPKGHSAYGQLYSADLVVLPGFSYIVQRGNSLRHLASVRRVMFPLQIAHRLGLKTALLNVSVGPLDSPIARHMVASATKKAHYVSTRETLSTRYLERLIGRNVVTSADTAFALSGPFSGMLPRDAKLVGLNILSFGEYLEATRGSLGTYHLTLSKLARELNSLMTSQPDLSFLAIPHEIDPTDMLSDLAAVRLLVEMLAYPERVQILDGATGIVDVISGYSRCVVTVGMRFHGYVFSSLASTPMIGLDLNSSKVRGIATMLGLENRMVNLDKKGELRDQVLAAIRDAPELHALVEERARCLRRTVIDSFSSFAASLGMLG